MSAELQRVLADASKLYDEDSNARSDEAWSCEAGEALLNLICELRAVRPVADVVMIPAAWFAEGAEA